IANENKGCLAGPFIFFVRAQAHLNHRIVPHHGDNCLRERYPLRITLFLTVFALLNYPRINSQVGVVEEYPSVDLTDIYAGYVAGKNIVNRSFDIQGDVQILGEVVQGAQGKDSERDTGADQHGSDGTQGAVTAAGDYRLAFFFDGTTGKRWDIRSVFGENDVGLLAAFRKDALEKLAGVGINRADRRIEDTSHLGRRRW